MSVQYTSSWTFGKVETVAMVGEYWKWATWKMTDLKVTDQTAGHENK